MREKYFAFLNNIWQDPLVLELIESGYIFVLPERDSWGRRVVWSVARRLDPARHNTSHVVRAHIATFEVGDNILQHYFLWMDVCQRGQCRQPQPPSHSTHRTHPQTSQPASGFNLMTQRPGPGSALY